MISDRNDTKLWFAMSAPYQNELRVQKLLDKASIECFVPMCYKVIHRNGKKYRVWQPAVSNLVFVRATRPVLQETKRYIPFLQYHTRPEGGRNVPITVPDEQMDSFIKVCRSSEEKLVYLTGDEISRLEKGVRVRVLDGIFDGVEGTFVRLKGCRKKRIVVQVQGLVGVALTEINTDLIEVLD